MNIYVVNTVDQVIILCSLKFLSKILCGSQGQSKKKKKKKIGHEKFSPMKIIDYHVHIIN